MPNIHDCLGIAQRAGTISAGRAAAARAQFRDLVARYETIMPTHQAQAAAAADLKEATQRAARSRYHAVVNQLQAARRLKSIIEKSADPAIALRNLLEYSDSAGPAGFRGESVRSLADAYVNHVNAMIGEVLERHGLNVAGGVRNQASFLNLIREAHGDASGDAGAKALADALGRAQEWLRQSFNAAGGDIGKIDRYGLPHTHDAAQLRLAGFDKWRADIEPLLDWSRITDLSTGRPFGAAGAVPPRAASDRFLRDVFDGITTRGWDDRDPKFSTGGAALYNQRAEHRVLHFSAEGWLRYNKAYGGADPFSTMVNGLHGIARDIAEMRVLGPNPTAGLEFASQVAKKRAETLAAGGGQAAVKLAGRVSSTSVLVKAMLAEQNGSASVPVNAAWARFMSGTRAVITSTQLGSAVLSSVTDLGTITIAAKLVGMNLGNVLSRSARLMASHATQETAARMGYVAQSLADAGGGYSRFMGATLGGGIPQRLAGFTLRASGLTFLTDMNRTAFRMEFAGFLADNADRAFAAIDAPLRRILESRGITGADWDHLRAPAGRFRTPSGEDFITPFSWLEQQTALPRAEAEGLAMRLQMAIEEQLEFAVPTASLEGRARVLMGAAPGSIAGELLRSTLMYRGFSLSLMLNHYRRFMAQPTPLSKASYAAAIFGALFLLGAGAVQLKEIAKGRDPRPMDDRRFWMAALFQGGGLGIFGDFFASETSRVGGGIGETVAGPVAGLVGDLLGPVASNGMRAANGERTMFGRDVANLVRFNTPVASSLWPTRLAFDRIVADNLQRFLDPEAEAAWRRQERQRERDYSNTTWWERGELGPERAPNLASVRGGGW